MARLSQIVLRLPDILCWMEDIDVFRCRSCARACLRSTADGATGKAKIAHVLNVSRQLSQDTATRIVAECLSWPALCSVRCAELDRCRALCRQVGVEKCNAMVDEQSEALDEVPTAVARISVALAHQAAAMRIDQPMAAPFFPALRVLDLDAEKLNIALDATRTRLQDLIVTFSKEAPNLQELCLPFYAEEAPKLEPVALCESLGLLGTGGKGQPNLLAAPLLAKLCSADLLNSLRLPGSFRDAWWTGFLCRGLVSLDCVSVFRRESEGCFYISEDVCSPNTVQAFTEGFFGADALQERPACSATSVGFSGTDLRGPCRELARFLSAFPNLQQICIGGSVTCDFDLMGCLVDDGTFSGLAEFAPERLAKLKIFSVLFSHGLAGSVGLVSFLRAASPSLQKLDFSGCDFGGAELKLIAKEGCEMPALRIWRLVKCPIGTTGAAKCLGQAVARFGHLEELDLGMCRDWHNAVRASLIAGLGDYPDALLKKIIIGNFHEKRPGFNGDLSMLKRQVRTSMTLRRRVSALARPASQACNHKK